MTSLRLLLVSLTTCFVLIGFDVLANEANAPKTKGTAGAPKSGESKSSTAGSGYSDLLPKSQDLNPPTPVTADDKAQEIKDSRWVQPGTTTGDPRATKPVSKDSKVSVTATCTSPTGTTFDANSDGYAECMRHVSAASRPTPGSDGKAGKPSNQPGANAGFKFKLGD